MLIVGGLNYNSIMSDETKDDVVVEFKRGGRRKGAGRPPNAVLVGSICEHFRPYAEAFDRAAYELASEAARSIAHKYSSIQEVLRRWDDLTARDQARSRALDSCVIEAGMDLEEFKALVGVVLKAEASSIAQSVVNANLPALVQTSIDAALNPDNSRERMKHLEASGFLLPPPGQTTNVNVSATAQAAAQNGAAARRAPPTFDEFLSFMEEADKTRKELPAHVDDAIEVPAREIKHSMAE